MPCTIHASDPIRAIYQQILEAQGAKELEARADRGDFEALLELLQLEFVSEIDARTIYWVSQMPASAPAPCPSRWKRKLFRLH